MRTDDNLENHMVLNTPDAPWNQPDAPEESAFERQMREQSALAAIERAQFCEALVEVAEFLESHPDVPLPFGYLTQNVDSRETFLAAAAALAKGGKIEKKTDFRESEFAEYRVSRNFGPINFNLRILRTLVCRLVSPAVYDCPESLLSEAGEFSAEKLNAPELQLDTVVDIAEARRLLDAE